MAKFYASILIICLFATTLSAQMLTPGVATNHHVNTVSDLAFINENTVFEQENFNSDIVVGIADLNRDGLDDIIRIDGGRYLKIEYQQINAPFVTYDYGTISTTLSITLAVADIDNNGYNDILIGDIDDIDVKLLIANDEGTAFTESTIPASDFLVQGSNFVDINGDNLVDIFICDDDAESKIWENTGGGNFVPANDWIDMTTVPPSDNSGNYASAWTDIDNDGDLDLYISKCRIGVENSEDPRRINQLFINEGNMTYVEKAEEYGLKIGAQSWTSDFQDIDNDGDLDCYVANHMESSQLFENDGTGHFAEITVQSGIASEAEPYQVAMRDFNNDGFIDILTAGKFLGYQYFENQGDGTFSKLENVFNAYEMGTFAIGDLNHDGFLDVYSGSRFDFDVLWRNLKNDNHFFAVTLRSNNGNPNAVGARLELYGDWGIQIREVRSGESYGIMNTFTQHFGLGAAESIDSLVVRWPSGNVEVFEKPLIDQFLSITENECAASDNVLNYETTVLCSGDTVLIEAPVGGGYAWSNGADTRILEVTNGGTYQVTITNQYGCTSVSKAIEIEQDPDVTPSIEAIGDTVFCFGSSVVLSSSLAEGYTWSNGKNQQSILVFNSGVYSVTTKGACEDLTSVPITVNVIPIPEDPTTKNDTIQQIPASGLLEASGENIFWYDAIVDGNLLSNGNTFATPEISESTDFYAIDITTVGEVSCKSHRVPATVVVALSDAAVELDASHQFSVFPNPTSTELIVEPKQQIAQSVGVQLLDITGRVVFQSKKDQLYQAFVMDVAHLTGGLYTLIIETEDQLLYKKVVID